MNGQMINYDIYSKQLKEMHGPYFTDEIPSFKIDYKGMIAYARKEGKKVPDLTDEEKEMFTNGTSMKVIRDKMLKD